jgi:hypothetical protein
VRLGMGIIEVPDDLLREGFVQVPVKLLKLPNIGLGAKLCYCCLLWYAWKVGYFPGQNALAQEFGSTDRSVRNYFTELQRAGLIEIHRPARRGEVLSIRLTPSSEWPETAEIRGPTGGGVVAPGNASPEAKATSRRKKVPSSPETKSTSRRKTFPIAEEKGAGNQRQDLPGYLIDTKDNKEEPRRRGRPRKTPVPDTDSTTKSNRKAQTLSTGKDEDNIFADVPPHYLMAMLGFARGLLERGRADELVVEVLQGQGLRLEQAQEVLRILRAPQ